LGTQPWGVSAAESMTQESRYQACMTKVEQFPQDAFEDAIQWRDMDGGHPAQHCAASALAALGLYKEAATRLEHLAQKSRRGPNFRSEFLRQASQAWLLGGEATRAKIAASVGLKLNPTSDALLLDRAQAQALLADYAGAKADLDLVVERNAKDVDALAFRAAARRFLNDYVGAMDDATRALTIDPNHEAALLERGNLHRLAGNRDLARADWVHVTTIKPDGHAAASARVNLERMDVVKD